MPPWSLELAVEICCLDPQPRQGNAFSHVLTLQSTSIFTGHSREMTNQPTWPTPYLSVSTGKVFGFLYLCQSNTSGQDPASHTAITFGSRMVHFPTISTGFLIHRFHWGHPAFYFFWVCSLVLGYYWWSKSGGFLWSPRPHFEYLYQLVS